MTIMFTRPGSGLPLVLHYVPVHLTNNEMKVCLLGHDLLNRLVFNFVSYLSSSYDKIHNMEYAEVDEPNT